MSHRGCQEVHSSVQASCADSFNAPRSKINRKEQRSALSRAAARDVHAALKSRISEEKSEPQAIDGKFRDDVSIEAERADPADSSDGYPSSESHRFSHRASWIRP